MTSAGNEMLPECSRIFGELQQASRNADQWRDRMEGRMDRLGEDLSEIKGMLQEHIGAAAGGWQRIHALEENVDKIDNRIWGMALKVGGVVATLTLLTQVVSAKLF